MSYSLHYFIYYGSFLVFPFLVLISWLYFKKFHPTIMIVLFLISLLFIYARFIERYFLVVHKFEITDLNSRTTEEFQKNEEVKIAVFSDIHLGIYKDQNFLKQVVDKVNEQKPDLVLIPGDFIYYLPRKDSASMFSYLQEIKAPVFAVTGNHDAESPGDYRSDEVRKILEPYNVKVIDNQKVKVDIKGNKFTLIGLSDIWEGKTDYSLTEGVDPKEKTIILVHNPDAAYQLKNSQADLVVSGHTHGGQIRIPFLYKLTIPTKYDFDQGFYDVNGLRVFVTTGVGEVGLPMRLFVPPEIAILTIK